LAEGLSDKAGSAGPVAQAAWTFDLLYFLADS
jgi:hypothetical protein